MKEIAPTEMTELEMAATRSELAAKHRGTEIADSGSPPEQELPQAATSSPSSNGIIGTILEAAFVDPAYGWPAVDGQGRNAIELQASASLMNHDSEDDPNADIESVQTTDSMKRRMKMPSLPKSAHNNNGGWKALLCCRKRYSSDEEMRQYQEAKALAQQARREHAMQKKERAKQRERQLRRSEKYNRVPEGILIYRLDTSTGQLQLVSNMHAKSSPEQIVTQCIVRSAEAAPDKNRRSIRITTDDEEQSFTLTACEQRTATAWLEAITIMTAKKRNGLWSKERLRESQLNEIEDQYLNLANYSHKLIRAGALPGTKKGSGGAGGIYYSIDKVQENPQDEFEREALEAIAKRRAIIKDSWDFYRMICSLLRDRYRYDEVFRKLQLDPVYPYLNSMTGLNDPGDVGYENLDKNVIQRDLPEYASMTKVQVAKALCAKAEAAMPSLVEICKALAGSLGMEEVGVGPIKEPNAALRKAEKKYGGDLLKVTDYCRALLVVKDFPALLALLELARDSFGPLITRVKMSTLKRDHKPKPGGYRDCIINVELKGHICEIQVHLWPMWTICGVDGFRHYRHCVEYNTDSFEDPYDALEGLDRKTMAELIVMAEEAVAETPLENLEWYHEKFILEYFAEAGLFMKHGLDVWAEIIYRHLIKLRTESPDIGPNHHETIILYKYLAQSLRAQNKLEEGREVMKKVHEAELAKTDEQKEAEKSLWDSLGEVYDMVVDPSRKEREEEQKLRQEVRQSKKNWRRIREERFPFLDLDVVDADEKKVDDVSK